MGPPHLDGHLVQELSTEATGARKRAIYTAMTLFFSKNVLFHHFIQRLHLVITIIITILWPHTDLESFLARFGSQWFLAHIRSFFFIIITIFLFSIVSIFLTSLLIVLLLLLLSSFL